MSSRSTLKLRRRVDGLIPGVGIALSVVGLVMILSASQYSANDAFGEPYYFFIRQLGAWGVGLLGFMYFYRYRVETLFENRWAYFWLTIGLLVLVFLPFIGMNIGGVRRWIYLGPIHFQPAEIAKLTFLVFLAGWLAQKGDRVKSFLEGWLPFVLMLAGVGLLITFERDMGTTVVILMMGLTLFFVSRADIFQFLALIVLIGVSLLLVIKITPYQSQRLNSFLGQGTQTTDENYHSRQALIAVGNGGLWGVGLGQGLSKHSYLPEAYTDSIFPVIAEELGFVRTSLILLAYMFLVWRSYLIVKLANSRFVQLLAVGIAAYLIIQTLINVSGMLQLIPLTGVPLPFISYGGTSLIVSLSMLGLLSNISRETK